MKEVQVRAFDVLIERGPASLSSLLDGGTSCLHLRLANPSSHSPLMVTGCVMDEAMLVCSRSSVNGALRHCRI
ncbi:hypothetical protein FG477_10680 [Xylella fastidiosa subsp. multiplex]|uniref:hypothetical protein n=1 Tax=Xylella fastidiosa TaxID=2371 RepID=UPI000429B07A|nr:hypothetical protein [Xylella fastidiosa]MDD0926567.1 hypothetical protein [Xylella fastidiosa subsp. multiplex]MRU26867.1 hypothetical protein [Xylella fastidiosa subsp. multiplex]